MSKITGYTFDQMIGAIRAMREMGYTYVDGSTNKAPSELRKCAYVDLYHPSYGSPEEMHLHFNMVAGEMRRRGTLVKRQMRSQLGDLEGLKSGQWSYFSHLRKTYPKMYVDGVVKPPAPEVLTHRNAKSKVFGLDELDGLKSSAELLEEEGYHVEVVLYYGRQKP